MDQGRWWCCLGFSRAAPLGVRPPPPDEPIKSSVRFTFEEELDKAIGEVEVPILGEVAGLEPAMEEPSALVAARRAYGVAQSAFERARARERRSGCMIPKAITKEYLDAYEVLDRETAKYGWAKAGDRGSIQFSRSNIRRFSKGF